MLKKIAIISSAMISGVAVGALITAFTLKTVMENTTLKNGAWFHNPYVGSDQASGYSRAAIAIIGFLGMTRDESIYFVARTDDEESALRGSCTYRIDGKFTESDARWWSITVYNAISSKLIANEFNRYSFNGDNIELNEDGSFTFRVSSQAQQGNWIPVGENSLFDLTLRMYNPSEVAKNDVMSLNLPTVTKEGCS